MITQSKEANAVAGKTARACDACVCKRARWYCSADDAFLCHRCDASIHSANQLASRHDRVRLSTASLKLSIHSQTNTPDTNSPTSTVWHQGFTRKARTPRNRKDKRENGNIFPLVPDMGRDEAFEENEEQLLYCVPVFDPFSIELCKVLNDTEPQNVLVSDNNGRSEVCELGNIHGVLPSDMELAEFAADVENLLGTGIDEGSCGIEGLGLIDCKEEDGIVGVCFEGNSRVKVEEEEEEVCNIIAGDMDSEFDMTRETIDWNFGYESPVNGEEEEDKMVVVESSMEMIKCERTDRNIFLKLNYDNVITDWNNQGICPWLNGTRPELDADGWPEFMGMVGMGASGVNNGGKVSSDGGREAKVTRYREKRRNRLFSKKIRYQVRKLNAEKRPRMKGRFVKRAFAFGETPSARRGVE